MLGLSHRLDLRQSQSLVMTPQLQQAIKLLQLSNLELTAFVERELEQNPLLERDESDPDGGGSAAEPPVLEPALPSSTDPVAIDGTQVDFGGDDGALWQASQGTLGEGQGDFAGDPEAWRDRERRMDPGEELPGLDQTLSRDVTLRDHLMAQLGFEIGDPVDRVIGAHLIDLLDHAGYLRDDLGEVASFLGVSRRRVEAVLGRLQHFEPTGVFARDLGECLRLQLAEHGPISPAMECLLANLPMLAERNMAQLTRLCGVDGLTVTGLANELRALDPKPGLTFDGAPATPIVPDITLRALHDGSWQVELNSETLPRVLVNTQYYRHVSQTPCSRPERDYLSEKFQSANWLVKSLHQRATTILKVATEIVKQQDGFFRHGVTELRPLVLRDIAEAIGMHESTVSRVTTNKYMLTPRGTFELKYFFTSSIPAADGGLSHSAEAVRFRIKNMIDAEPGTDILSDDRIVDLLHHHGIEIARRTVAKYREAMRIPSSVQRRRDKSARL